MWLRIPGSVFPKHVAHSQRGLPPRTSVSPEPHVLRVILYQLDAYKYWGTCKGPSITSIVSTATQSEALSPCPAFVPSSFSLSSLVPWLFWLKLRQSLCRNQKGEPSAYAVKSARSRKSATNSAGKNNQFALARPASAFNK
ncbi:uncharacterized protein LOC135373106 [Ornithodoros turicata]|uniref:uncharacterized protein LOC135373106 n=1 Tax=Ornithodoros turicata TaxID=34597 RepID=UPI00313876A5